MGQFLSTLSLRRATSRAKSISTEVSHFYPRSPCGERHQRHLPDNTRRRISIHALLAESDVMRTIKLADAMLFLSTLSLRRATKLRNPSRPGKINFYPRSPCGERLLRRYPATLGREISIHALLAESDGGSVVGSWPRVIFLSTLSLRRATRRHRRDNGSPVHFYPRSPCGERLRLFDSFGIDFAISIHALLAESDLQVL